MLGFQRFPGTVAVALVFALGGGVQWGQTAPPAATNPAGTAPMGQAERVRWAAEALVGKALFLRGFYLGSDLRYGAAGQVEGTPKVGEWTVAGVNVQKVLPRPGEIELDGVRVAVRYNPDQHQFERHALNDEKVRVVIAVAEGAEAVQGFEKAVAAVFAVGIDPGLQRSMPDYWQHYFNAGLEWPQDGLNGVMVYPTYGMPNQAKDVEPAKVQKKAEAKFTSFAEHDRVKGAVLLRMVVDAEGVPRRIMLVQPLGYGLDAEAVAAMTKWRFAPGVRQGATVATAMVVAQEFEYVAMRR